MARERLISLVLWLSLVAVAFGASPPASPDTWPVIERMMTGRLEGVNLPLFALFNLMGVFPLMFLAVLALDSSTQRAPKWTFVLGSFALGAFALLPYLVLRQWNLPRREATSWWLRALTGRVFGVVLVAAAVGLLALFVTTDVPGFVTRFKTQQFPFVMSFDFLACAGAAALLAREEARVRGDGRLTWLWLVPVVGLPLVQVLRRR